MLTEKQITDLQKPFDFNEHRFSQKNPYILKSAIRARLNRVAPGWHLLPPELVTVDGDVVIMRGGIRIGDISRYGVGTGIILRADTDGVVFGGAKLAGMISKAYKTAASDILPRAAIEFGIGEYLKNKPKDVNKENFAGWLSKLTATPADPNAWTIENTRTWLNRWRAKGLTDNQLFKALNIADKWSNFTGTVADADKAVDAFLNIAEFDQPAQPKVSTKPPTRLIDCPVSLLEPGDVIYQTYRDGNGNPAETRYEVVEYWGKVGNGYSLKLKKAGSDKVESFHWTTTMHTLCAGPKVDAVARNPELITGAKQIGGNPQWNGQTASLARA